MVVIDVVVVMLSLFGTDATGEAPVVTVVDADRTALLTLITGAGTRDALNEIGDVIAAFAANECVPCAGNVGMILPVAKMFCCSMNNRCSA